MSMNEPTDNFFELIQKNPKKFMESEDFEKLDSGGTELVEYLYQLLKDRNMTLRNLVSKMPISKSYMYQITSKRRNMGRDSALLVAVILKLSLEETQKLLKYSGNATLYPKIRRDAILLCRQRLSQRHEQWRYRRSRRK